MKIAVIDTETTGDEDEDVIIEGAIVTIDDRGNILSRWHSLFHPGKRPISPAASASHHLTKRDFKDKHTVWLNYEPSLWTTFVEGCDYVAAHNVEFDKRFLPEFPVPWICTYRCARHIYPDADKFGLQYLRYWLNLNPAVPIGLNPHRALYDAICCAALLANMLSLRAANELSQLTTMPLLLSKVNFGKYRNTPWSEVPLDYLHWLIRQDFDDDTKYTAKHWITKIQDARQEEAARGSDASVPGVRGSNGGSGNAPLHDDSGTPEEAPRLDQADA